MSAWPKWRRADHPDRLLQYIRDDVAGSHLAGIPLRTADGRGGDPLARVEQVYAEFARRRIRYCNEPLDSRDGSQRIRPIGRVVAGPKEATCIDLVVAFATACLSAGIHPIVLLLEPVNRGPAHAMLAIWMAHGWPHEGGHPEYPDIDLCLVQHGERRKPASPNGIRPTPTGHGDYLPLDVAGLATPNPAQEPAPLAEAVAQAVRLIDDPNWTFTTLVDVGRDYRLDEALDAERVEHLFRSHAEVVAELNDGQRNLLAAELTFEPPTDPTAPIAPDRLLTRLTDLARQGRGIVLHGTAGIGKTRTSFEVAQQAITAGWAVLHAPGNKKAFTADDLCDAVRAACHERVLVILDYVNEALWSTLVDSLMAGTELRALQRDGITVALLGCCRTGWFRKEGRPIKRLLEPVELTPDAAQEARTRDRILATLAPTAWTAGNRAELQRLAGSRPGIVMLIAREVEKLGPDATLDGVTTKIPSESLVYWLTQRLAQDKLLPAPTDSFHTPAPDPALLACLAMFVASPQPAEALLECATAVEGLPEDDAEELLARLRMTGWLVPESGDLKPVHDVVTDQLTEHLLLVPDTDTARRPAVRAVLGASLTRGRTLGRFATNLDRTVRDLEHDRAANLTAAAEGWLHEHAEEAGALLATTSSEGEYAASAIIRSAAWGDAPFVAWDALVAPWLASHPSAAPHLLCAGLRVGRPAVGDQVVGEALTWLSQNQRRRDASFLLRALRRRGRTPEDATAIVGYSLRWLAANEAVEAGSFVLPGLFDGALPRADATAAIRHSLAWLHRHHLVQDADYVLRALLDWDATHHHLSPRNAARATRYALAWLREHHTDEDASFVLRTLLDRDRDHHDPSTARSTIRYALAWLRAHHLADSADHVLHPLLDHDREHRGLTPAKFATTIGQALAWLRDRHTTNQADYVLRALLERDRDHHDLGPDASGTTTRYALAWLHDHHAGAEASYVLRALLERDREHHDLGPDDATKATGYALAWLDDHHTIKQASFVLRPLFERGPAPADAATAAGYALAWLHDHHTVDDAGYVLRALLERDLTHRDLASAVVDDAIHCAHVWLRSHDTADDADFVLHPLLRRAGKPDADVLRSSFGWLERHHTAARASYVLGPLLGHDLAPEDATRTLALTFTWLEHHHTAQCASRVLDPLLGRGGPATDVAAALDYAFPWLDRHLRSWAAQYVLGPALELPDLRPDALGKLCAMAAEWVRAVLIPALPPARPGELGARLAELVIEEVYLAVACRELVSSGAAAERLDRCLATLCTQEILRTGVLAALLDEALRAWIARPEALRGRWNRTDDKAYTSRLASLLFHPDLSGEPAKALLGKVENWMRRGDAGADDAPAALASRHGRLALVAAASP